MSIFSKQSVMDLYKQICTATLHKQKITFTPGLRTWRPEEEDSVFTPDQNAQRIEAWCRELSPSDAIAIDSLAYDVVAPPITERVVTPGSPGTTEKITGYNENDPQYRKDRLQCLQRQDAMTCLLGCPDLSDSTPGDSIDEKSKNLMDNGSASIIAGLAEAIRAISHKTQAVDFFSSRDSSTSPGSKSGKSAKKQTRKRALKKA